MKSRLLIILTAVILLLIPNAISGQVAPTLGATSSFALFTAGGAFSNIGAATVVTGDVGNFVGAFTAFPPGTVVGLIDPPSAQAAADVLTAYSDLTQAGTVEAGVLDDLILSPGVYNWGGATSLSAGKTITLDGGGNPNAIFIITIGGLFSTGTFTNVVLTNSADLCNVYWQVNGAFTLGDGSVFRGTLIATGAIHLLEASSLFGRGLSTAGAIDLHNNVVTIGTAPAIPGAISGTAAQCSALAGQTYNIAAVANATTYTWAVPAGWSITAGAGTTGITVTTGAVGQNGNITVTAGNGCGTSAAGSLAVTVNPALAASVSIAAVPSGAICAGTSVIFTATPVNGGTTPAYQWKKGGTDISGETSATYTSTTLANTDVITVVMTSNATPCLTGSPATSNTVTMTVNACALIADFTGTPLTICQGSMVTFTNTSTGTSGGTIYSWDFGSGASPANAATIGPHLVTYSTSGLKTVTLTITDGTSDTKTKTDYITVNPLLPASVNIAAVPSGAICSGTSVTFTATPVNGGTTPAYQWKKGGTDISGETNSTYTSTTLANSDVITVVMTSNAPCATGSPATSPGTTMAVNPLLPVSVSIAAVPSGAIIAGTSVTYTATPVNGGTIPVYQWKVNGISVGINSNTYSYIPLNTDVVTVVLTSNEVCKTGSPATSLPVTMTVSPLPAAPTIGTITQPTCVMPTGSVVLSGLPAGNWTINPGSIAGSTASITLSGLVPGTYNYTVTDALGGTSSASANVVITASLGTPGAPIALITQPTCLSGTGSVVLSGLPAGNWTINPGSIAGSTASTTISGLAAGTYNYTVTNASGCTSVASANIVVNSQPATPAAPVAGTITQPTCLLPTGSVVLSGLPAGNWTINPVAFAGSTASTTVSGLAAGTYNFTVANASGCISAASANVVINTQPIPAAPTVILTQPDCNIPFGTITVLGPVGVGMTYSINGTDYTNTTGIFTMVPAGTYTVTAKNSDGCITSN